MRGALARDRSDWRIWLTAARIDTEAGRIGTRGAVSPKPADSTRVRQSSRVRWIDSQSCAN